MACSLGHSVPEDPEHARSGALTGDVENEVKIHTQQLDARDLLASTRGFEYRTNHLCVSLFDEQVHIHRKSRTL